MQVHFASADDYRDFLYSEFDNVSGSGASFGDRFDAGRKAFETLSDDLSLDAAELDLEAFA